MVDNLRDKLERLLSVCPCESDLPEGEGCPDRRYGNCRLIEKLDYCAITHLARHLIANGVTFAEDINVPAKWIPVTERLPALHTEEYEEPDGNRTQVEESDDQWVIDAFGHQTKARYETGVVFQGWVGEYGETVRNVTHWMPLPEPPVE